MSKVLCLLGGLILAVASIWAIVHWWSWAFAPFLLACVTLLVLMTGVVLFAWGISSIMEASREKRNKKPKANPSQPGRHQSNHVALPPCDGSTAPHVVNRFGLFRFLGKRNPNAFAEGN